MVSICLFTVVEASLKYTTVTVKSLTQTQHPRYQKSGNRDALQLETAPRRDRRSRFI